MHDITDAAWRERIRRVRGLVSSYNANRDLIAIGAYQKGTDPRIDEAIERWPLVQKLLLQDVADAASLAESRAALEAVLA